MLARFFPPEDCTDATREEMKIAGMLKTLLQSAERDELDYEEDDEVEEEGGDDEPWSLEDVEDVEVTGHARSDRNGMTFNGRVIPLEKVSILKFA